MAKKENQKKNGHANDQWQERKRAGRPKQVWIPGLMEGQQGFWVHPDANGKIEGEKDYEQNNS